MKRAFYSDDDCTYVYQGTGNLHDLRGPEDEPRPPVKAVLWVPDPEQRHGWREVYVRAKPEDKSRSSRSLGFGGRQERR